MTGIDRDVLITRVLDGEATPEDWAAFRAMADRDHSVWADLADAQQDRAELATALSEAVALADDIEAPLEVHAGEQFRRRFIAAGGWFGWAAAAVLALGAATGQIRTGVDREPARQAGLLRIDSPEDALQVYMDKGQEAGCVIGEVPERVLISSAPTPDGQGYTVVYLRQIIERQRVEDFYTLGRNEAGQPVPVPYARPEPRRPIY
ncbi:MAG TPA: hypothetical protein VFF69_15155 [Phycisphaerales bacterium]|nr:hypothetical protein [Phycisphaerales bacterium]